jgi:hypothetical protein
MKSLLIAAAATVAVLSFGGTPAKAYDPVDGSGSAYGARNLDPSGTRAMRRNNRVDRIVREQDSYNSYNSYDAPYARPYGYSEGPSVTFGIGPRPYRGSDWW